MKKIIYIIVLAVLLSQNISKADNQIIITPFDNMKIKADKSSDTFVIEEINYKFSNVELLKFIQYSLKRYINQVNNPPCGFTIIIQTPQRNITEIKAKTYNEIDNLIRDNSELFVNVHVIHLNDEHCSMIEYYWNEYNNPSGYAGPLQLFESADSPPEFKISLLGNNQTKNNPLKIKVTISSSGITPVAIDPTGFQAYIMDSKNNSQYLVNFEQEGLDSFITVHPKETKEIILTTSEIVPLGFNEIPWEQHKALSYKFRLSYGSGKEQKIDYYWLGMTGSNEIKIKINPITNRSSGL